jgi:hypothetical protein
MYSDPQSVTINAVAHSLARVGASSNGGIFRKDDGTVKLSVSHTQNKRARRMIRLDHNKLASDPYVTGDNFPVSMGTYLVVDVPLLGYTITEQKQVTDGFAAFLTASSGAAVLKLLGGEI